MYEILYRFAYPCILNVLAMRMTRGTHQLDPQEFPPSNNWTKNLPHTNVSMDIVCEDHVYQYPGHDFMEYYVKEVGYQPPKDFVETILKGGNFIAASEPEDLDGLHKIPLGFLRKNSAGIVVDTQGRDDELPHAIEAVLGRLPQNVETEFLNRIQHINQVQGAFKNVTLEMAPSPILEAFDSFLYPFENWFADPFWLYSKYLGPSYQVHSIKWNDDKEPDQAFPGIALLCQEDTSLAKLKEFWSGIILADPWLKDISHELGDRLGFAFTSLHEKPKYIEGVLARILRSQ